MSASQETENIAARWLLRREDGLSDTERAMLEAWLDDCPENRIAFWRLEHGWEKADRLSALRRGERPRSQRPVTWWQYVASAALAASLILGTGFIWITLMADAAYRTDVGGHRTVALTDGTKVELNTATTLRTEVTKEQRQVWLDKGEAYFEVAHDPAHPFIVHAGNRVITVLGTKFSVFRDGDRVEVVVSEGRVRVDEPKIPAEAARPRIVTRGDIVIAEGPATLVTVNSLDRGDAELSWRKGRLTFNQVTLAEAVGEFNRYNQKKLVITDADVARIRIGGSFEAGNVEAFTRLLQKGFGLKIDDDGKNVKISG